MDDVYQLNNKNSKFLSPYRNITTAAAAVAAIIKAFIPLQPR